MNLKEALKLLEPQNFRDFTEIRPYIDQKGIEPKGEGECCTHIIDLVYWMKYIAKRLDEGKIPLKLTIYEDSKNSLEREEGVTFEVRK